MAFYFQEALKAGVESVTAWADYLDRINVFPVADGDTGTNLIRSLAPLRNPWKSSEEIVRRLLLSARGNSGNIASQFFVSFLTVSSWETLEKGAVEGSLNAWRAIPNPKDGTILTFYKSLAQALNKAGPLEIENRIDLILDNLEATVRQTTDQLPPLKQAHVVDSGALGMYIFFETFLSSLATGIPKQNLQRTFLTELNNKPLADESLMTEGFCVDAVIRADQSRDQIERLKAVGDTVTVFKQDQYVKVHFHVDNPAVSKETLAQMGEVINFQMDDLRLQTERFTRPKKAQALHVLTDAAGSLSREDAQDWGFTLIDSYIQVGDLSLPETYFEPKQVYEALLNKVKVSTSQASNYERSEIFRKILSIYPEVLYLCVGSAFTGNYDMVMDWKKENDPGNRLNVIDTGAASGRLGLIALAVSEFSQSTDDPQAVVEFAKKAVMHCQEYIFLDTLKYLAAGGRLSKPASIMGDLLRMKPVISPLPEGVKKVASLKNQKQQIAFAMERTNGVLDQGGTVMLEYSNNKAWVKKEVQPLIQKSWPKARIIFHPFSLTTGVHIGPGSWAIAMLPPIRGD